MSNMKKTDEMEKQLAYYEFKLELEKGEYSIMKKGTIPSEKKKEDLDILNTNSN